MMTLLEGWMRQIDRPEKGTSIALFDAAVQLLLLLPWGQDAEVESRTAVSDGRMEWTDVMMLLIMINALGYAGLGCTARRVQT